MASRWTGTVIVWVPGKLTNPMNGSHGHWTKHRRWAKAWREHAAMSIFMAGLMRHVRALPPKTPKAITFTAHVGAEWDDDNLRAAIKPIRDALKDMRIIDDDKPSSGHTFTYRQVIERGKQGRRGVQIEVEACGMNGGA